MDNIVKHQNFWSENDDLVLKAIREGFLKTQNDMWADLPNWTKTNSGLPSTAGTTASIAFIRSAAGILTIFLILMLIMISLVILFIAGEARYSWVTPETPV